jgi:hypothetical protein
VRKVIEPVLAGTLDQFDPYNDDIQYVSDLGLIPPKVPLRIANPIYREAIVRALAANVEFKVVADPRSFVLDDGRLDFDLLLHEFAAFWREHADVLTSGIVYHEVAPHLVLMGYLQRIINGGGHVDREYGTGRGHLDRLSLDTGALVIFDRRPKPPPSSNAPPSKKPAHPTAPSPSYAPASGSAAGGFAEAGGDHGRDVVGNAGGQPGAADGRRSWARPPLPTGPYPAGGTSAAGSPTAAHIVVCFQCVCHHAHHGHAAQRAGRRAEEDHKQRVRIRCRSHCPPDPAPAARG